MGHIESIGIDHFPKQGELLNRRTKVCFNYDPTRIIMGTIVRDDMEDPFELIIKLDDDRIVRSAECQYSPESA